MVTVLYIYTIGMMFAFIISCILASYYEYILKEPQDWRYVAAYALMSWVTVVLMIINYRKQFIRFYKIIRTKFRQFYWKKRNKR